MWADNVGSGSIRSRKYISEGQYTSAAQKLGQRFMQARTRSGLTVRGLEPSVTPNESDVKKEIR
jgi:hypothetical protein